jgi:hypothetical protein
MPRGRSCPCVAARSVELRLLGQNRTRENEANDEHQRRKCAIFVFYPLCPLPPRAIHGARSARSQGAACLDTVRSEFKFVSQLLSDGRPFICGQQLTAADITFVALALPVLSVPYASVGPVCDPNVFTPPPEMAAVIAELRGVACPFPPSLPSPPSPPSLLHAPRCSLSLVCFTPPLYPVMLRRLAYSSLFSFKGTAAGSWAAALYQRERSVVLQQHL